MKVVSIVSGAIGVNIWLFIASCIVARGGRFASWLAAAALRRADPRLHREASRSAGDVAAAILIALFFAVKYLRS
jgi:membrane protein DedA with SNARE-associated domain